MESAGVKKIKKKKLFESRNVSLALNEILPIYFSLVYQSVVVICIGESFEFQGFVQEFEKHAEDLRWIITLLL